MISPLVTWMEKGIRIVAIVGVGYLFVFFSGRILRGVLLRKWVSVQGEARRRIDTILPLLQSFTKYVVVFFAAILILRELGVDATALLAGAGVVGIAIGFGAQTLVKDIVTGMLLLFEDTLSVGDVVEIGNLTGKVEEITLRVTRLRLFSGALLTIPNGEIGRVANYNRGFTRAVIEVNLAYEADLDKAVAVLQRIAEEYYRNHAEIVLEPPVLQRIVRLGDSSVVVRIALKVLPQEHWGVERDLLYLVKKTFDEEGIEIPYQKQVVYVKEM